VLQSSKLLDTERGVERHNSQLNLRIEQEKSHPKRSSSGSMPVMWVDSNRDIDR
jgi:hypothetical protein